MVQRILPLTVGLIAGALLLVGAGATAQTQTPGFGGIVEDVDDIEQVLRLDGPNTIQFRDGDEDGQLDWEESVYLADGSSTEAGDLRIANPLSGDPFTKISSGDADAGRDLTTLDGDLRYVDTEADGALTPDDTLYFDLRGSGEEEVSRRDVILAGLDAGTLASTGHEYLRYRLEAFDTTPRFGHYDEDDDGTLDRLEPLMLDVDDDGYVTIGDVRLGDTDGGDGGTIVSFGDADATYRLDDFSQVWEVHFRDRSGDSSFNSNEPVYLNNGDSVAAHAVRLANPTGSYDVGSQVRYTDDDWRINTHTLNGEFAYVDEDGTSSLTAGDTLYYDHDGTQNGEVSRGDVILSGPNAGETADGTNADLGADLRSYGETLRYLDLDADGQYSYRDIVYGDTGNDLLVSNGTIQLSHGPDVSTQEPVPPSVTITAPEEDAPLALGDTIEIEGTATAGDAPLESVNVTIEDEELDVTGLEDFSTTWTPDEAGDHTLTATVTDEDGRTNSTTRTLTVEQGPTEPPTVTITNPGDEDEFPEDETLTIEGTATPGDANLSQVTVEVDGEEVPVEGLEHWNATWEPTGPGSYLVEAAVTDEADQTATQKVNISIAEEQDPPSITIQEPQQGTEAAAEEPLTIEGTASAGSSDLADVTVTAGGEELQVEGLEDWSAEWTPESEGDHVIEATVMDENGLTDSDTVTITTVLETPMPGLLAALLAMLAAARMKPKGR